MTDIKKNKNSRITISRTFFNWLMAIVIIAFLTSMAFSWIHQTNMSRSNAEMLLRTNVSDVRQDVIDASDENLLELCKRIAQEIDGGAPADNDGLFILMDRYDVAEINIIDQNGVIIATTYPDFQDYYMGSSMTIQHH